MPQDSRIGQDWQESLDKARATLERSKDAPDWLAQALRAAETVPADLAPMPDTEYAAPEFSYPH
jgi:hypothetical protein